MAPGALTRLGSDGLEIPSDLGNGFTSRAMVRVFRSDLARFEILYLGEPVRWIRPHRIGRRAMATFYSAVAYMPGSNEQVNIAVSADLHERCRAIMTFRANPEVSVHFPDHLKRARE